MRDNVKKFIEQNIQLIQNANWADVYNRAKVQIPWQVGNFSCALLHAGINPLEDIDRVFSDMFSSAEGLTQLIIPDHIKRLERAAFIDCFSLKQIQLPASLEFIHDGAFRGCYELEHITYNGTWSDFVNKVKPNRVTFHDCATNIINCTDGAIKIDSDGTIFRI